MSRIRTNLITNRMANGAPTVSNGLVISGVTTATTLDVNGTSDFSGDAVFNSKVGIGSAIPANSLDVQGTAHAKIHIGTTGTSHATGIQINHAKGNAALQEWQLQTDASADGNLLVRNATSGTSTMFFDADTNNVGINETSPDRKLHVGGSFIRVDDGYGLDTSGSTEKVTLDNGFITLTTNSNERLRLTSTGQLLVNTTSASISSNELFEVKSTGGGFSHFRNNSSTYAPIYIDNEASNGGATLVPLITMTDGGGNRAGFLLNNNSQFDISAAGSLSFSTGNNVGSATQRMRILGDGRVLVNTDDGAAFSSRKLTVSDVTSGGTTAMEIRSATNGTGRIYFTDSTSSSDAGAYAGKVYYDHPTDHMAFYTGGSTNTPAERMKIDAYGRVTKPNQPLFVAQKSAVISGGGSVVFNTVVENVGSHYNSSNGRFTAPVAGYYWFCCKINAYKRIDWHFRRNGSNSGAANREIGQFNTSNQDGWYSHNLVRIFELNVNDWMEVYVTNITQNSDPGEWITFQGYLLQ